MRGACGFRAPADYKVDINIPARTARAAGASAQ